jgi:hypothetical protein
MGAGHGPFGGHGGGRWGRRGGGHGGDDGGAGEGLRARMESMQDVQARGVVQTVIAGRRGSPRTLLLSNNTTLLLPRAVGEQLAQHGVRVGDAVQASGRGGSYPQGTSLIVRELVLPDGARFTAPSVAQETR